MSASGPGRSAQGSHARLEMPRMSVAGTLDALEPIRDYAAQAAEAAGLNHQTVYDLCLAVDEIATNIVLHGYEEAGLSGDLAIAAFLEAGELVITLEDWGLPYDPNLHNVPSAADLQAPLEARDLGGLGIMLAKQAVDELSYEATPEGNKHRFSIRLMRAQQGGAPPVLRGISDPERKLEILLHVSKVLGEEILLDNLLRLIVAEVTSAMSAERSSLFLYDEKSGELVSKIAEGLGLREIRVPVGVGIAGATAKTREKVNIPDAYKDPRFNPEVDKKSGFVTRSILSMPIISQEGKLIGVVQVLNKISGEPFNIDDELFLRAMCVHLGLALERAVLVEAYVQSQRMQQSLQLAHDIQMGLLPKKFPAFPDKPEIDIHAMIDPAQDVGGDLYDFFLLDANRVCFVIGDVSDKGIPAALFMAMVRTAFKISAMANPGSVGAILRTVNRFIFENNDTQMFVTMFAGILDSRTGRVDYSDGGHELPIILRQGGRVELFEKKGGIALGFLDDFEFPEDTIQLGPGDALVLYTDGVNEAMNNARALYQTSRICECLAPVCDGGSALEVTKTIIDSVAAFVAGAPQSDDITVLTLRYQPQG